MKARGPARLVDRAVSPRLWPTVGVVLGLLVGAASGAATLWEDRSPGPREQLAAEMDALRAARARLQRVGELVTQDRWEEAKASLAAQAPGGLGGWLEWWSGVSKSLPVGVGEDPAARLARLADWLFLYGERPDLAVQMFEAARERGFELSFDQLRCLGDAYVLVGRYAQARQVLDPLSRRASGIKQNLERISRLESGQLSRLEALRERYAGDSFTVLRVALANELWAFRPSSPAEDVKRLFLLAEFLGDARGVRLARETIVHTKGAPSAEARRALGDLAWSAYQDYDEEVAFGYWQMLLDRHPSRAEAHSTLFQMAALRREQGRCSEATVLFRRLVSMEAENAPDAQWQIGHCLYRAGDYRRALQVYREAERRYPFDDCCVPPGASGVLYGLYQGLCLERMGQVVEAISHYLSAVMDFPLSWHETLGGHLIDLYDAGGRLGDLEAIAGAEDEMRPMPLRDLLALRRMEKAAEWDGLIGELKDHGTTAGPEGDDARAGNVRAVEAARLLCRHADRTVPLLLAREHANGFPHWVAYALGRCATPPAVAALKRSLAGMQNVWGYRSLVYVLELSPAGRDALGELDREGKIGPKEARRPHRSRLSGGDRTPEFGFPPVPASLELPARIAPAPHEPLSSRSRRPRLCICM